MHKNWNEFIIIGEHLFTTEMDRPASQTQLTWYGINRIKIRMMATSIVSTIILPSFYRSFLEGQLAPAASFSEKIWVPDLYFNNEKSSRFHKVWLDNKLIRITREGEITYRYLIPRRCGWVLSFSTAF